MKIVYWSQSESRRGTMQKPYVWQMNLAEKQGHCCFVVGCRRGTSKGQRTLRKPSQKTRQLSSAPSSSMTLSLGVTSTTLLAMNVTWPR